MKFNKKLVVTSLSTVLGLGIVGSITGTVAWYQYSTRGTASLIGMSAGESGVLQLRVTGSGDDWKRDVASNDFFYTSNDNIRADQKTAVLAFESGKDYYTGTAWDVYDADGDPTSPDTPVANVYYYKNTNNWASVYAYAYTGSGDKNAEFPGQLMSLVSGTTDVYKVTLPSSYANIVFMDGSNYRKDNKLRPCTWGGFGKDDALPTDGAFGNPVLGKEKMDEWKPSTSDVDYFQFSIQLKTVDKSTTTDTLVARKVWLTDIVLRDAADQQIVTDALRMHLSINDGTTTTNMLIANSTVAGLTCHGNLDLDGDGKVDTIGGYDWNPNRNQPVDYGKYNPVYYDEDVHEDPTDENSPIIHHQGDLKEYVIDETLQTAYGINDVKATAYDSATKQYTNGISIGSTVAKADSGVQNYLTITVTVWLEGWAQLDPQADPSTVKAIWDSDTLNRTIHAGLTFDIGDKAFSI